MSKTSYDHLATQPLTYQLPPEKPFISLSHAISWIAWRHSIAGPELSQIIEIGKLWNDDDAIRHDIVDSALACAVERLMDLGSGGEIKIRGRYFRNVLVDEIEVLTQRMKPVLMADYRWFDTLDDALHRGIGLAWSRDRQQLLYPPNDDGHYRFVTVNRADLMREFPSDLMTLYAEPVRFNNVEIDDWIRATAHTGMKIARKAFMREAGAKGLSATFEVRWNAIKQNGVGRPRAK